jgi:hypothetical protein
MSDARSSNRIAAPEPRPPGLAAAALVHALLWLHGAWSATANVPLAPLLTWILMVAYSGSAVFIYWRLSEWLVEARDYDGADRYLTIATGLILVDAAIRTIALATGSDRLGSGVVPLFGPYSVLVGYQYLYYFALGTLLIAIGWAVIRAPDDDTRLRWYGRAVAGSGMLFAAFLGDLAIWPGVAADLLLAWRFGGGEMSVRVAGQAEPPETPRSRPQPPVRALPLSGATPTG